MQSNQAAPGREDLNNALYRNTSIILAFNKGLRPDSIMSVSDWADANRVLSQTASSEPGSSELQELLI